MRTDDPVNDAEVYFLRLERELECMPICDRCGHHIQTRMLLDLNEIYCEDCAHVMFDDEDEQLLEDAMQDAEEYARRYGYLPY